MRSSGGMTHSDSRSLIACVTRDPLVLQRAATVAAAAAVELVAVEDPGRWDAGEPADWWLGPDFSGTRAPSPRTCVIAGPGQETEAWALGTRLGGLPVGVLPHADRWLVRRVHQARSGDARGRVIGLVPAAGGLGCTTLTVLLGAALGSLKKSVLVTEADPQRWGLEDALAMESFEGVRWEDLVHLKGDLNPDVLRRTLPQVDGLTALTRGSPAAPFPDPAACASVLTAARDVFEVTLIDLAGAALAGQPLAEECESLLVLLPPTRRGVESAKALVHMLGSERARVIVCSRGLHGTLPPPEIVAELVGVPLAGHMPHRREILSAEAAGTLTALSTMRCVRRLAEAVSRHEALV